jgi:general stress protein YciG
MAIKQGRCWHGDKTAHQKTGSIGGKATAKTQGLDFFAKIGAKGGTLSRGNFKNNLVLASEAGRRSAQKRWKNNAGNRSKKSDIMQALYNDNTNSIEDICKKLNISLSTLYRYIKVNRHIKNNQIKREAFPRKREVGAKKR